MIQNIGNKSFAARVKNRVTKKGKNAGRDTNYLEFTVTDKQKGTGVTYRIYYQSTYTPSSGKNAGMVSCPVTASYFKFTKDFNNGSNAPMIF